MTTITRRNRINFDMTTDPNRPLSPSWKGSFSTFYAMYQSMVERSGASVRAAAWYNGQKLDMNEVKALCTKKLNEIEL